MKKVFLFVLINCFCIGYANSQDIRPRYVFDNFQTARGVQVTARKPASIAAQPENKSLVKETAQTAPSIENTAILNTNAVPASKPVNKLLMSAGKSLGGFTTGDLEIDSYIVESSARYNIDPLLIYAQMHQESGFKRRATSYKGASGLMQLMPATAMRFGVTNIYDPKQNIDAGIKYMRWLINKFNGNINLALAGYNAGEGAVMKYGNQIPPYNETQNYVKKISARYNSIKKPVVEKTVKVSQQNVAKLEVKQSAPLTDYQRNTLMARLPNGKIQLSNR